MNYRNILLAIILPSIAGCSSMLGPAGATHTIEAEKEMLRQQAGVILAQVQALANTAEESEKIRPKDIVTIQVWMRDMKTQFEGFPLNAEVPLGGQIFIPGIGTTFVVGSTDAELTAMLSEKFAKMLKSPTVLVEHKEKISLSRADEVIHSARYVSILGWIEKPGIYPIATRTTVRDIIAHAGGPKIFAKQKKVYLVRGSVDNPNIITLNLRHIKTGRDLESNLVLQPNDAIYMPPVRMWRVYDAIRIVLLPISAVRDAIWLTSGL
ncbi:MAG: polysaccharide biosynthesis/export family protein [Lentisphaerae bacterium]|nr:polysaccharide biosynthesis/export family protein [Lentisphaerota bacterium]